VLTERPVSPSEPARCRLAKKGRGNKRTRKALLIAYELVQIVCKAARSYAKKWRQASSLVSPFRPGPCRAGEARPQKHTKMEQKSFRMLLVLSRFEASSTEALCSAVLRSPCKDTQRCMQQQGPATLFERAAQIGR
jgi:hypothetical protein